MNDFELIIFDCDGVIVDSEILSCGCLLTLLHRHGIAIELPEIYERFLGRSFQAVVEYYQVRQGQPAPATFRQEYETLALQTFSASLHAMQGIGDLLRGLKTRYCLASSSDLKRIELCLSLTGLADLFDGRIFTAQMVKHGKPAPDLFLHAAANMSADPARTLVIEDSVTGITAGKAAGMTVWGFTGGSHYQDRDVTQQLAASGATRLFARMSDLQGALTG